MRDAQRTKMEAQVKGTSGKIDNLSKKLSDADKSVGLKDKIPIQDWAARYDMWSSWEDIEELNETLDTEKTKLDTLKEGSSFMGHYHDHAEERRIFDLPEDQKIQHCERYRLLGNYLTTQGFYSKALEHFQIALSYYEYCFPETPEDDARLASIRHACLTNASLSAFKLSMFRESLDYAAQVLKECAKGGRPPSAKAHYRRAHAWKALGNLECAMNDFEAALELCPGDGIIEYEILLLKVRAWRGVASPLPCILLLLTIYNVVLLCSENTARSCSRRSSWPSRCCLQAKGETLVRRTCYRRQCRRRGRSLWPVALPTPITQMCCRNC